MAEVKNFEDLKSDEVQNSLDGKLKDLIKEIDDFNDENNSNIRLIEGWINHLNGQLVMY